MGEIDKMTHVEFSIEPCKPSSADPTLSPEDKYYVLLRMKGDLEHRFEHRFSKDSCYSIEVDDSGENNVKVKISENHSMNEIREIMIESLKSFKWCITQ